MDYRRNLLRRANYSIITLALPSRNELNRYTVSLAVKSLGALTAERDDCLFLSDLRRRCIFTLVKILCGTTVKLHFWGFMDQLNNTIYL